MGVLHIKQNLIVRVVVTEKFKEDFKKELTKAIRNCRK